MSGADKFAFGRFSEKRKLGSDTVGYDEYIEGVEPDETSSLDAHIKEDNRGFKLIQKMGWESGTGLGKFKQGRVDPVPFEKKDDHMGLGRWALELELAQDATEKRKQMEIEKELTDDLVEKYKAQAEKERHIAETLAEMHKSFYCELCDRQYTKYSEYDNHINSYSHHHQQRLKDLKQYETGRRFGGHRDPEEQRQKILAVHMVALERAKMNIKRKSKGGFAPAFKPIGQDSSSSQSSSSSTVSNASSSTTIGVKRSKESEESQAKIAQKKAKLAKFGLKFQSAGTLVTIGDQLGRETSVCQPPPATIKRDQRGQGMERGSQSPALRKEQQSSRLTVPAPVSSGNSSSEKKLSFGFNKRGIFLSESKTVDARLSMKAGSYTSIWEKAGSVAANQQANSGENEVKKGPPPKLMSRQRELTLQGAFDSDSDEEDSSVAQLPIKAPPKFHFNIRK